MKEKLLGLLDIVKNNKKNLIKVAVALVVVIIVIAVLSTIFSAKPKKYKEKIKTFTKALSSESKMKDAIEKYVDLRGAAAFQEADLDYKDLKKEYKKMKKDADEVDDMEKALKAYAKESEDSDVSVSVSKIGKPKQNSKNKKIYTVSATMSLKSSYGSIADQSVRFVFYKGKIIDILSKGYGDDSSMFKNALDSNK